MEIQGKVAIVTGASEGIGRAVAEELARKGAKVVLAARSRNEIDDLSKQLPDSLAIPTDMTKQEDVERLVGETRKKYGRIDILVNNAGVGLRAPVEEIDMEKLRYVYELNVFAPVYAMQLVIPVMREEGGGAILNISSQVSKMYIPGLAGYSSTKYAINSFTLTAREELAGDGIVVSVFHPKMTATNFGQHSLGEKYESRAGRPGMGVDSPEDVAKRVVALIESGEAEDDMRY